MRDSIAKSIKSTVNNLHQIGVVDEITMKNIENLCLPDIVDYSPQKITSIRKRSKLSQAALANVPAITIYEVSKVILRESTENDAFQAAVAMQKGTVVDLTASLAIAASRLSIDCNLPMADSIILATAHQFNAIIWTQDSHFENIHNVKYFPKK